MFDFKALLVRMFEKGFSQRRLASGLGISENALVNKLKGRTQFTSIEIASICNFLDITKDEIGRYFFTQKV